MSYTKTEKSITTTMDMLNTTYMGRARGLEKGLKYCLKDIPDAEFVTITAYKWTEDEEPETIPNPRFMGPPSWRVRGDDE